MVTKELIEYVKKCREIGYSDSQIRSVLRKEGWSETDVLEAMFRYAPPKKKKSWQGKLYLFITILLSLTTVFVTLLAYKDFEKTTNEITELTTEIRRASESINTKETQKGEINAVYRDNNLGFEVVYPSNIFVWNANNFSLVHALKNFHKYSLKDGSDLGPAKDIEVIFSKDVQECIDAENNLEEIAEPFVVGEIRGLKYEMGTGGEGTILYCLRNDSGENIFLIKRNYLSEAWSSELVKQEDFIPLSAQEKIFNKILESFKLI